FPDVRTSREIGLAYAEAGADLLELGVPFSDPLADGPVIHAAGTAALRAGATLEAVLEAGRAIAEHVPVVAMCYSNPILARGLAGITGRAASSADVPVAVGFGISTPRHASAAADAGADGVIVGTRLVRAAGEADDPVVAVGELVRELSSALMN